MEKIEKKVIPGWTGRCYEDFEVGEVYRSRFGRTVTTADNQLFTHLTLNTNPLHFDEELRPPDAVGKDPGEQYVYARAGRGDECPGCERAGDGESGLERDPASEPGVCGRYALLRDRGARQAGVEVVPGSGYREGAHAGRESGWPRRHRSDSQRDGL